MVPSCCFVFFFFLISPFVQATATDGAAVHPTQLVDKICNQTSEYSSCVNSLYSDPRTPDADQYTLASIAVGLAYNYAVHTRDLVSQLLTNASSSDHDLQGCVADYDNAVSKLVMASNDLNSETFSELGSLSAKASYSADHCQKAFPSSPTLTTRNKEFKGLCEIVAVVGELFTGAIIS